MTEENRREAAELAKRAAREQEEAAELAKRAARKGEQAAKDRGRAAVGAVSAEAQDTVRKLEGTAEDAVETAKRVNPWVLGRISGDTGQGFMALAVAVWAGTIAVNKFRSAYRGRHYVMEPKLKYERITPSQ